MASHSPDPLIWTPSSFLPSGLSLDILWVLIKHCIFWKASLVVPVKRSGLPVFLNSALHSLVPSTLPHNLMFRNSFPQERWGDHERKGCVCLTPQLISSVGFEQVIECLQLAG